MKSVKAREWTSVRLTIDTRKELKLLSVQEDMDIEAMVIKLIQSYKECKCK